MVELSVQIVCQVLYILLRRLLSVLFFKHSVEFEHSGDVVALVLVFGIIDPLVNLTIGLSAPLHAGFEMFFDGGHGISFLFVIVLCSSTLPAGFYSLFWLWK